MSQQRGGEPDRLFEPDGEGDEANPQLSGSQALLRQAWAWLGLTSFRDAFEQERARWVLWVPVALGAGIATYFGADVEPSLVLALAWPSMALGLLAASRETAARLMSLALLVAGLGFLAAKIRTEWVRAPVLEHALGHAEVTGTVTLAEPRPGGGVRITLRDLSITGLSPAKTPSLARIRVMRPREPLKPGDRVTLKARLSPPQGPALPGGYDFARTAWFWGLGATGFAYKAPVIVPMDRAPPQTVLQHVLRKARDGIEDLRQEIARRITDAIPGELGALATALITGERGGISEETTNAFRDSGLLHILSISGLHMVVMAGAVYAGVRACLAAIPTLALAYPIRRYAAAAASVAAFIYLLLSGASVATVRAYLMIAIMFLAVMLDRPALAMRNVASSALLILVIMPESLLDPGFQMSYACVVALISAYEHMRASRTERDPYERLSPILGPVQRAFDHLFEIVISTLIASVAVAPFAIYHFHKSQQFALIANLIAIPISNIIVMPAGLVTLLAMPFGLEPIPLAVMSWGLDAMRATADWVASLPGAVARVSAISDTAFAFMVVGGLWLTLWQTRWRMLGLAGIAAGAALAPWHVVPDLLVGDGGRIVAVRAKTGELAVLAERSSEFVLTQWLEHDGDERNARDVRVKSPFVCDRAGCTIAAPGLGRVAVARHEGALDDDCKLADILIARVPIEQPCSVPKVIIDGRQLYRSGPMAAYTGRTGASQSPNIKFQLVTGNSMRGDRPWSHVSATQGLPSPAGLSQPSKSQAGSKPKPAAELNAQQQNQPTSQDPDDSDPSNDAEP